MTVTPLSLTACGQWAGFLSISLSPVAVRPTPCQRPMAGLSSAASPTGDPDPAWEGAVGNAELWLPGHAWLLGTAAARKPKALIHRHIVRFGGPHPPSQPAICGSLVSPRWSAQGCQAVGGLSSQAEASRGERRALQRLLGPRPAHLAPSSVGLRMAHVKWDTFLPGTDHGHPLRQTRGHPLPPRARRGAGPCTPGLIKGGAWPHPASPSAPRQTSGARAALHTAMDLPVAWARALGCGGRISGGH